MDTAAAWYEERMKSYEDGEAALLEAQRRADDYWKDLDKLKSALQDTVITDKTIHALMVLRQLIDGHPAALAGAAMMVLEQFETAVVEHILENEDLNYPVGPLDELGGAL